MKKQFLRNSFSVWLILFGLGPNPLLSQDLPPEVLAYADMVLYNGKILTADEKFTLAGAVAIRDGKILAVGENPRILKMAGPNTEKIDLKGNSVTPGFIEVHTPNFVGTHGPSGPIGTVPVDFPRPISRTSF